MAGREPVVAGRDVLDHILAQAHQARIEDLHLWLQDHLLRVPGWSDLAKAMRHVLRHWHGLILYLDDGRLEMGPLAWLTDVLQRIVSGQTKNQELHTLLPWNWRSPSTAVTA